MNLKIAIVQTTLIWEDSNANLAAFNAQLENIESDVDVIVLPEMFTTGFSMNTEIAETIDGEAVQWMKEKSKALNAVVVGSLMMQENQHNFNRLIWMFPNGDFQQYDKRHLFRMMNEHKKFTAGDERIVVEYKGFKICPLICYDLRFPVWSRNTAQFDCMIYVANWPSARRNAWSTLLLARAIENQCYVVGVNRVGKDGNGIPFSGDSVVIDPKGNPIVSCEENKKEILVAEIGKFSLDKFRASFPVADDADQFELLS